MAGRLFDLAVCLDWIAQERGRRVGIDPERPFAFPDFFSMENRFRLLGAVVSHALACVRTLWDTIPPVIDLHLAEKRGQIPAESFRVLAQKLSKYERLLDPEVVAAVTAARASFDLCRKLRDGILHQGYQMHATFSADGTPLIHVASGGFDVIANQRDGDYYDPTELLAQLLENWLRCWKGLRRPLAALLDPNVPEHNTGRLWGFHLPAMIRLAELLGNGDPSLGWRFVWPCGPDCVGALGACEVPGGTAPASVRRWDVVVVTSL
jgi:hypothetical protein